MSNKKEYLTWAELRDFCNNIPDEFINEEIRWWGDEKGGLITSARILDEDHVCTEEGWELKSAIEEDKEMYPPDEVAELPLMKKGHPVLWTDF